MTKKKFETMPELATFKKIRESLGLSMDEVAVQTHTYKSAIYRIENGLNVKYSTVKKINDFYASKGA